jgi:hypothetical protein
MKKFYKLFNVPMSNRGINTTDLIGAKASSAFLNLVNYDKGDGTPVKVSNQLDLSQVHV